METSIEFDDLEKSKAKVKRLKGSLTRELLRSISFRISEVFPSATRIHIVLYPDNVYRIWAVTSGKRWLAVCEDDVAPSWTSLNLDRDVDLVMRLEWNPRINSYTRQDGEEVHSVALYANTERKKALQRGKPAGRLDEAQVPGAEDARPV